MRIITPLHLLFASIFLLILTLNILLNFQKFYDFKKDKIIQIKSEVLNIYPKNNYDVIKLKTSNFVYFTSTTKNHKFEKLDIIMATIYTQKISFYDYMKGFYTNNIFLENITYEKSFKQNMYGAIKLQHNNYLIKELFSALFLAVPISSDLRDITNTYGISHLLALSGFHLGLISFVSFWLVYFIYKPFHQKFVPYRNKKFDTLLISGLLILAYLIFTDIVPSLLRAFVMYCMGIYLLRNDIKIFSFLNLFIVVLLILAFFPKYLLSISLWFSIAGVFYILLYVKYYSKLNIYISFILFNFWIFFALNPIILYFFDVISLAQLFSAPLTLLFILFYPFEILVHFVGQGDILDEYIMYLFNLEFEIKNYMTSLEFMLFFVGVSFLAIYKKIAFYLLNILIVVFNFYVYLII
jgi:competence protein ComEC